MLRSSMGSFRSSKLIFDCSTHYKIRLRAPGSVSAIPVTVYRDLNFIAQDLNANLNLKRILRFPLKRKSGSHQYKGLNYLPSLSPQLQLSMYLPSWLALIPQSGLSSCSLGQVAATHSHAACTLSVSSL